MARTEKDFEIVKKYYLRKKDGQIDYEHPYDFITDTYVGRGITGKLWYVRVNGKIGYLNRKGEFTVPMKYDLTRITYEKKENYCNNFDWHYYGDNTLIAEVYKNNGIGIVDEYGEELVPCEFEDVEASKASEDFIPVALPICDNSKLGWGMYDVKNKRVSVIPQYEEMSMEQNGYASFKENGKWGILYCADGTVVVPAIYLLDEIVPSNGILIEFLGGNCRLGYDGVQYIWGSESQVLVINGTKKAQIVVSGYNWAEESGPCVVKCKIGNAYVTKQEDNFKILKMPDYIGIVKNAVYESGCFLKENGKFVKEWIRDRTTKVFEHAKYLSGGTFSAMTYDGKSIAVTEEMKKEILKRISEE